MTHETHATDEPGRGRSPAAGTAADGEPGPETLPSFTEQVAEQLGGVRGLVESSIPVAVFVVANLLWELRPALIAAVGSALLIAGFRLSRRQPVRHALNGLFGIGVGAFIAWRTGEPKDFYLPGIVMSLAYAVAMLISVTMRRPLVGWIWTVVAGGGSDRWHTEPRLLRVFSWLTVLWAAIYLVKVGVQYGLYLSEGVSDTTMGVVRLALGYPPYIALLAITVWSVRRVRGAEPAT